MDENHMMRSEAMRSDEMIQNCICMFDEVK